MLTGCVIIPFVMCSHLPLDLNTERIFRLVSRA